MPFVDHNSRNRIDNIIMTSQREAREMARIPVEASYRERQFAVKAESLSSCCRWRRSCS